MNIRGILWTVLGVLAGLVLYDMFVKKALTGGLENYFDFDESEYEKDGRIFGLAA